MKSLTRLGLLFSLALGVGLAAGKEGGEASLDIWKWANFLLLAGALGYLVVKNVPPLFAERSQLILKDMTESEKVRQEADARVAEVESRLNGLEAEIAALRAGSQKEAAAETERLAAHTAAEIAKIQAQTAQEVASAGKAARTELKRHAAELAIGLAEQKIRGRMTPQTQDGLVRGFVRDLK